MIVTKVDCPLCNLKKKTHWYYENELFIICDCLSCKVPMYVWKDHDNFPTVQQRIMMYTDANQRFSGRSISLLRRSIKNHFHFHCR